MPSKALTPFPQRTPAHRPRGRTEPASPVRGGAEGAQRSGWYFGGIRIAPSRRIVSPLSMSFVMMLCTSLA